MIITKLLFSLIALHFLCDYPLQGDLIARLKCRKTARMGVLIPWWHLMTAHAFIHGGAVYLATGRIELGIFETVVHFGIDVMKCEGYTDINLDQILHIAFKVSYVIYIGAIR